MKKGFAIILGLMLLSSTCSFVGCEFLCEHEYVWVNDNQTHAMQCSHCGEVQEESKGTHESVDVEAKYATYTEEGNEMGKICAICKRILEGCKTLPARTPFKSKTFGDLNYFEYLPTLEKGAKAPLVLYLHGSGERGSNNQSQLKHTITEVVKHGGTSEFMNAVVLAPQCPAKIYWTNADHANGTYLLSETSESEILKSVMSLVNEYLSYDYIDASRVYVIGVSMGGFATWELLARYPDTFAAAVPICGGGPTDAVETLKNIPIYTFHGVKDPIVPYAGTQTMVELIKDAGGRLVVFKTFENSYHDIWNDSIVFEGDEQTPALAEWLFSQKK